VPGTSARATHSLKSAPGGGHVVRERDVELDLAVVGLDDVVPAWELAGGDVDLEVDLGRVSAVLRLGLCHVLKPQKHGLLSTGCSYATFPKLRRPCF
jgi:hypothetical protein